jgi:PAS domain S-box-containing protein
LSDTVESGEDEFQRTAAKAASLTAQLAGAAARAAELAEKVAHVGTVVAREYTLPAICAVVLDETIRTLNAQWAVLYRFDRDKRTLRFLGERGIPEDALGSISQFSLEGPSLAARAASTRRVQIAGLDELDAGAVVARDLLKRFDCETIVGLPLVAHDQLVAVMTFALKPRQAFSTGERATLDSCAHVFSFAIAHAMVYEQERRLRVLFEAVGQATVAVVSELELQPSLQNIVDEARVVVDAEYGALGFARSEDLPFDPWVWSGVSRKHAAAIGHVPRPVGILGAVARGGGAVRIADVRQHPAYQGVPPHHPVITSFLGVPVSYEHRVVGILYLANKRGGAFSAEDQKAIELLAAHAGAVVHQRYLRDALNTERSRLKAIIDSAPHGVVFVEPATGTLLANPRARELAGDMLLPDQPPKGEVFTPDGSPVRTEDRPFWRAMRGELVHPQELLFRHPDGREVPVIVSAAPVRDIGTKAMVVLFEDITILKQLQSLREEWADVITHELRQPIARLAVSVGLLRELARDEKRELFEKAVSRTERAVQSLTRLVDDLADVSRIESNRLVLSRQRVSIEALVRALVEEQQARIPDRVLSLAAERPPPPVEVDPVRIEQVLSNLISNAIKYSAPNTPVDIEVRVVEREVRVRVTNQGPGLPPEELPRVFDRHYRTAQARAGAAPGRGLGLYVAKGIIEAHGGRIWAESRPGVTATFEFALPVAANAETD